MADTILARIDAALAGLQPPAYEPDPPAAPSPEPDSLEAIRAAIDNVAAAFMNAKAAHARGEITSISDYRHATTARFTAAVSLLRATARKIAPLVAATRGDVEAATIIHTHLRAALTSTLADYLAEPPTDNVRGRVLLNLHETLRPPRKQTVSEWADENRWLSQGSSVEPGRWSSARGAYQRGIMDALNDPAVETIALMLASQTGKTEALLNALGYIMDIAPGPILFVMPSLEMARSFSKNRLAPMIRDSAALRGKVRDPKSRNSENSILEKLFDGGSIAIAGANSAASLASRPIKYLLMDEVDRYPDDVNGEGDPVEIARQRTRNYFDRKIVIASTPTWDGFSRIQKEWNLSDQRRFHVRCPHCEHMQVLDWEHSVQYEEPRDAHIHCTDCGTEWSESDRLSAIAHGEWRATRDEADGTIAGFHLNELCSPWSTDAPASMAIALANAKGNPELMSTWTNTRLALPFEEDWEKIEATSLMGRLEDWGEKAPAEVLRITAGVDTQDDRVELEIVGWGSGYESWSLDYRVVYGEPGDRRFWEEQVMPIIRERIDTADGRKLPIAVTCIDAAGHHTQAVKDFCRGKERLGIRAIMGSRFGMNSPIWPPRASRKAKRVADTPVFFVGVTRAKQLVYEHLRVPKPGPGHAHFPKGRTKAYFDQLTSEVMSIDRTGRKIIFKRIARRAAEALDTRVYALAGIVSTHPRWGNLQAAKAGRSGDADSRRTEPRRKRPVPMRKPYLPAGQRGWLAR